MLPGRRFLLTGLDLLVRNRTLDSLSHCRALIVIFTSLDSPKHSQK